MLRRADYPRLILTVALLVAAVAAVFQAVRTFEFLNYDDPFYVTENPYVRAGITRASVVWAFAATHGNWDPLNWLSHMLDVEIFGMNAGAHHLVNVVLHALNVVLLFVVLWRMTGAWWRSVIVAALFATHPLHVEPVAWVSARKDVLSTAFWLLSMAAYHRYAMSPGTWRYLLVVLFFFLGLAAKPMLVTLPFVLLLMDVWPLGRLGGGPRLGAPPRSWTQLLMEKLPLIGLAVASSFLTIVAQRKMSAIKALGVISLSARAANATVSSVEYVLKTVVPYRLAAYYPFPMDGIPLWKVVIAGTALFIVTTVVVLHVKRYPYAAVGWFWYLGTLVPVIGLVQVGMHAMADRFTYIPLIGIFLVAVWGTRDFLEARPLPGGIAPLATGALFLGMSFAARAQVEHWRSSRTLYEHTLKNTTGNYVAENNLGNALLEEGKIEEAIAHFVRSLEINGYHEVARINLGVALQRQGRTAEAAACFQTLLKLNPRSVDAHYHLGYIEVSGGAFDRASDHYRQALALNPDFYRAHNNLGIVLSEQGKQEEAIARYRQALKIEPLFADAHLNLANSLERIGDRSEAIKHYEEATRLEPGNLNALNNLGMVLAKAGRSKEAEGFLRRALSIDPAFAPARRNLTILQARYPEGLKSAP